MLLGEWQVTDHPHGQGQRGDRLHGGQHRRGAAHVRLHRLHRLGGLSDRPPESKVIPLPASTSALLAPGGAYSKPDQPRRRVDRPLPDAEDAAVAALGERLLVQHGDAYPGLGRDLPGLGRERGRHQIGRPGVDQVAGQSDGGREHLRPACRLGRVAAGGHERERRLPRQARCGTSRTRSRRAARRARPPPPPPGRGPGSGERDPPRLGLPAAARAAHGPHRRAGLARRRTSGSMGASPPSAPIPTATMSGAASRPPVAILVTSPASPVAPSAASMPASVPPSASSMSLVPGALGRPSAPLHTATTSASASIRWGEVFVMLSVVLIGPDASACPGTG